MGMVSLVVCLAAAGAVDVPAPPAVAAAASAPVSAKAVPAVASAASAARAPARARVASGASTADVARSDGIERHVAEDDQVVVDELRVRGQSQRITVTPKTTGAKPYEIVPRTSARDPSQRGKGADGERVWRVLDF